MKYILVIGDGMADHPLDTLGGRTPLEASKKDAIDDLARHGVLGSVRNVPDGFAPGSDTAIMSIFGCSPRKYFFGRAPLEAAASGIRLAPGDACYRCNMVTYADEDVPFVLYDSRVSEGSGLPYSEANGAKGPYVDDGAQLMDLLFELKKL